MEDDEIEEEKSDGESVYHLTPRGYRRIIEWIRFQGQMCEMEHVNSKCDDMNHQTAILIAFVIIPLMQGMGISVDE